MPTSAAPRAPRRSALAAALALGLLQGLTQGGESRAQSSSPASGVRYLYLIRHGFYARDSAADDRTGNGLDSLGRDQARRLGARLAALPVRMDALVCSDFLRARQTADELGHALGLAPVVDSLIHECTPTSVRPDIASRASREEFAACDSNLARAWAKYVRPAGDSDRHEALVCHGNVIRWFVTRVVAEDASRWASLDIGNASLSVIAVRPDATARLVMFSDVGHLPVETQTWAGRGAGWSRPARAGGR